MQMRTLSLGLVVGLFAAACGVMGCSSSSNNPVDAGKKNDAGGDTSSDGKGDGGTNDAADAPVDGGLVALQARGKYLVEVVIGCPDCHTPKDAMGMPIAAQYLAGNPNFIALPNGDKLGTRNLTNDPTGLKNRTDQQIKDMFLNGQRPITSTDGGAGTEALNPVMPYYVLHNMKAEDADAIVAYLRTVPAVNNEIPRRGVSFDVQAPANYLDATKIPQPLATFADQASAQRGRYLASQVGLCIECHTKHVMTPDVIDTTKLFQGGEDFSALFATTLMIHPVSANLTSDNATGLGGWSVDEIKNALLMGKDKAGLGLCPPMPTAVYAHLMPDDAMDIANYIKSLPPATNAVPDMCSFPPMPPGDGGADGGDAGDAGDAGGN
jgi:hypothetical protein